ncbi:MAG: radical SAM/Cys-rich domain protein [Betaproteobacteria bacterium]|nr:MAG: radical SAM/Cys-rich domain protein [Betaproteobacteria bacterium]
MHATFPLLRDTDFPKLRRRELETLQVNLGYRCNQTCQHCHVNAGPARKEMMDADMAAMVVDVVRARSIRVLDLTGGAPELNPQFRRMVVAARAAGARVIDRCNLTVLSEAGQEGLDEFLAQQQVEVVASLPCYSKDNVDAQRGEGVFERSIEGLQRLNKLGYGQGGTELILNLVYNPLGPYLPPSQTDLEREYRRILGERFGVVFNRLFTIANMPIQRFGSMLISRGEFAGYMQLLRDAYRPENVDGVMCRSLISVDWEGNLYDCDFNQMLGLPLGGKSPASPRRHLRDLLRDDDGKFDRAAIAVADHCYGCTAGQGSSCGGALRAA